LNYGTSIKQNNPLLEPLAQLSCEIKHSHAGAEINRGNTVGLFFSDHTTYFRLLRL